MNYPEYNKQTRTVPKPKGFDLFAIVFIAVVLALCVFGYIIITENIRLVRVLNAVAAPMLTDIINGTTAKTGTNPVLILYGVSRF
jgi:hypothetical protein